MKPGPRRSRWITALFAAVALSTAASAEIHQWRDAEGGIHFGDSPPPDVETVTVTAKPNVYTSPSIERVNGAPAAPDTVILYSAEWCGYCRQARAYFDQQGIRYSEYDVEKSPKGQRDYKRLGAHGVPVILVGGQRLNGFSVASFESLYSRR